MRATRSRSSARVRSGRAARRAGVVAMAPRGARACGRRARPRAAARRPRAAARALRAGRAPRAPGPTSGSSSRRALEGALRAGVVAGQRERAAEGELRVGILRARATAFSRYWPRVLGLAAREADLARGEARRASRAVVRVLERARGVGQELPGGDLVAGWSRCARSAAEAFRGGEVGVAGARLDPLAQRARQRRLVAVRARARRRRQLVRPEARERAGSRRPAARRSPRARGPSRSGVPPSPAAIRASAESSATPSCVALAARARSLRELAARAARRRAARGRSRRRRDADPRARAPSPRPEPLAARAQLPAALAGRGGSTATRASPRRRRTRSARAARAGSNFADAAPGATAIRCSGAAGSAGASCASWALSASAAASASRARGAPAPIVRPSARQAAGKARRKSEAEQRIPWRIGREGEAIEALPHARRPGRSLTPACDTWRSASGYRPRRVQR